MCWRRICVYLMMVGTLSHGGKDGMIGTAEVLSHFDASYGVEPVVLVSDSQAYQLADARMSVFRSDRNWVIVFELIQFSYRLWSPSERFHRSYYLYGNCLKKEGFFTSEPLWQKDDHIPFDSTDTVWQARRSGFWYYWKDTKQLCRPTPQEYQLAGIDPKLLDFSEYAEYLEDKDYLAPIEWLRFLCHYLDHPFFVSESHLRQILRRALTRADIEGTLKLVFQTRDWEHPAPGELPSAKRDFRLIAQIICTGDSALWRQSHQQKYNSHWSYWERKARMEQPHWMTALSILIHSYGQMSSPLLPESGVVISHQIQVASKEFYSVLQLPADQAWQKLQQSGDSFSRWLLDQGVFPKRGELFEE